jgi:hypothetical protein
MPLLKLHFFVFAALKHAKIRKSSKKEVGKFSKKTNWNEVLLSKFSPKVQTKLTDHYNTIILT